MSAPNWDSPTLPTPKAYLSGPMRGLPDLNKAEFAAHAARLRFEGWDIYNPGEEEDSTVPTSELLKEDLRVITECSAVFVLPGWQKSRGARFEVFVAHQLGIPVLDVVTRKPAKDSMFAQVSASDDSGICLEKREAA